MSETMVLNTSVGSTEVLVELGIRVFQGTLYLIERVVVRYGLKGYEILGLISKGEEHLVEYDSPAVSVGKRVALGVDVVLLLEVVADEGDKGRKIEELLITY